MAYTMFPWYPPCKWHYYPSFQDQSALTEKAFLDFSCPQPDMSYRSSGRPTPSPPITRWIDTLNDTMIMEELQAKQSDPWDKYTHNNGTLGSIIPHQTPSSTALPVFHTTNMEHGNEKRYKPSTKETLITLIV